MIFELKIWILGGVKVCKSCRSRQTLQNEYLVAKIGFDTAANESSKVWLIMWLKIRNMIRYRIFQLRPKRIPWSSEASYSFHSAHEGLLLRAGEYALWPPARTGSSAVREGLGILLGITCRTHVTQWIMSFLRWASWIAVSLSSLFWT